MRAVEPAQPATSAITVTGNAQKESWSARALPPVEAMHGGVWSIPVPMTDQPMRYTLCYVLESSCGPVVIDPGWPDEAAWEALIAGFAAVGMAASDVYGVLVSHAHSDHHGLAGRLREASGCWIGMHAADIDVLRGFADGSAVEARGIPFHELVGTPGYERAELTDVRPILRTLAGTLPDRTVKHGDHDLVPGRQLVALWTPGHTPGHLVFADQDSGYLFTGDHLLPRITPHIGGYAAGPIDQLGQYFKSLDELLPYEGAEVLPAHEYRFRGVAARVEAMKVHHRARLSEVERVVRDLGEATVWDVACRVQWSRSWDETTDLRRRLALAETLAHLRHLDAVGRLLCSPDKTPRWSGLDYASVH